MTSSRCHRRYVSEQRPHSSSPARFTRSDRTRGFNPYEDFPRSRTMHLTIMASSSSSSSSSLGTYHVRGMVRAYTCVRCVCRSRLSRASGRHAPLIISLITGTSHRGGALATVSANDSVQAARSKRGYPLDRKPARFLSGNLIMAITIRPFEFAAPPPIDP